jgi:hypothetical protein
MHFTPTGSLLSERERAQVGTTFIIDKGGKEISRKDPIFRLIDLAMSRAP